MVYGGEHATLESASARERQLKRWSREKKQALVHHSARSGSQSVANGPNQPWYEVVGVVRDPGIDPEKRDSRRARVYHPVVAGGSYPVRMAVHTTGDPCVRLSSVAN